MIPPRPSPQTLRAGAKMWGPKPTVSENDELDRDWFVFSRAEIAGAYGLVKSKKSGIWGARADSESAAERLRIRIGASAWVVPLAKLQQRKPRLRYRPPSQRELAARAAERLRALADFAAGRDSLPWDDPIEGGRT